MYILLRSINTNACTPQIINSNDKYIILNTVGNIIIFGFKKNKIGGALQIIPRITWPALMFAANRNDNVIGRM